MFKIILFAGGRETTEETNETKETKGKRRKRQFERKEDISDGKINLHSITITLHR